MLPAIGLASWCRPRHSVCRSAQFTLYIVRSVAAQVASQVANLLLLNCATSQQFRIFLECGHEKERAAGAVIRIAARRFLIKHYQLHSCSFISIDALMLALKSTGF